MSPLPPGDHLDVKDPDPLLVIIARREKSGIRFKSFSPRDGISITSVTDGDKEIWDASGEEECIFAEFSISRDCLMLYLEIEDGEKVWPRFFEKVGEMWEEISVRRFSDNLEKIRSGSSE
ncbi:hypothetical protein BEWA_035460 [Theileria equi strain WA]|uniref:Uncharacterized protein n=1 Tax=Theileria equi strain WA TaxID=1537102 RepID=L1LE33_THEEQ|nr:hypothetical protein BEWA_035460 [Theileria equi strain WA]EKX73510.1 hypothetical protein BEWA_035460 [Theileria equi strain WA]|eukprot:XP_004832962.1 hypothetical protein BEWA_035460 [Theileria equi strain WA]